MGMDIYIFYKFMMYFCIILHCLGLAKYIVASEGARWVLVCSFMAYYMWFVLLFNTSQFLFLFYILYLLSLSYLKFST